MTPDEQTVEQTRNEAVSPFGTQRQPLLKPLLYSAANLGMGMFYALNNAILPLYLKSQVPGIHQVLINLMSSSHSIEGTVIQPLVGTASDRLRTRYGRRRPFMLLFTPFSVVFLLLTPIAGHLPISVRLAMVVGCVFLFTVSFNIAADPYQALMPDVFSPHQRGRVQGISMFVLVLGQVLVLETPLSNETKFGLAFGLTAVVMLVTTLITCVAIREPVHLDPEPARSHLHELRMAISGLHTLKQAKKALLGLFLSGIGIGAVTPSLTLFVKNITHCSDTDATRMYMILMISTVLGVLPFGWLSDRIGSKQILILGMVLIAVAALNGLWVTTLPQIRIVMLLAGLGNAAQSAAAYPLLTQLVPGEETGFYTGLQSTALSIAQPLTAVITGVLTERGGDSFRWIFAVCSISICLALIALTAIHVATAGVEVAERDRQQGRAVTFQSSGA